MMCFKDRTFCKSPECQNECGRKMTDDEKKELDRAITADNNLLVSWGYFCGVPTAVVNHES
jgi:hypothetical protein